MSTASVSYHLVRNFSWECVDVVQEILTGPVRARDKAFDPKWLPYGHAVAWQLLTERPEHFLIVGCRDWDQVLLDAVRRTMTTATWDGRRLEDFTWGSRQMVRIAHPFAQLDRRLDRWLAAPVRPLPGDSRMPRVQGTISGASQRMVVSPGREDRGIYHMPGGQSGHPLSRWFLAGHEAWVRGWPTPLLPGPAEHTLVLVPR